MIIGASRMQHLFRRTAGINVDKSDLKRISDLISDKLHDLLIMAERAAAANGRDVITEADLPLTAGFQRSLQAFRDLNEEIELRPVLERMATYPPLDRTLSAEVEAMLPDLAGALLLIMARSLKVLDPKVENPVSEHFDRLEALLELTL
ncbi:hypothetical protein SE15_13795 [Thermanaerothrix daxensis]|uniref:DUF1931 family protein n=1 Tax=Thermanaerothrix daxensis TaxID=869279 RepID=A0A0P6XSQ8_9CHLR|nr:DUF1931 family protein [Thermanaerothrix daxensis]KPL82152.1 hypothetical protein SE15_13795 [Thermanaerothrix daxensis]